ncbi:hypothetical protein GUJ93_ZPchr0010g10632 [Zizania palustris]|uniref:Uncharacterized protein n=1 Tax=Zizania palustris TaxID=103762 RepID=A0A8J5WH42_ZIZPA|nr:hypothetical protein GUJ93_ZPchr0010g10632 [Zizania palustris]
MVPPFRRLPIKEPLRPIRTFVPIPGIIAVCGPTAREEGEGAAPHGEPPRSRMLEAPCAGAAQGDDRFCGRAGDECKAMHIVAEAPVSTDAPYQVLALLGLVFLYFP